MPGMFKIYRSSTKTHNSSQRHDSPCNIRAPVLKHYTDKIGIMHKVTLAEKFGNQKHDTCVLSITLSKQNVGILLATERDVNNTFHVTIIYTRLYQGVNTSMTSQSVD
jgi:hypothetical protein